jgi:hypothetical protein
MTAWRTLTIPPPSPQKYYTFRWSRVTGVGIVTKLWVGRFSICGSILRSGKKFLLPRWTKNVLRPHRLWYSPIFLSLGSWEQSGVVVNLTTYLYLMVRLEFIEAYGDNSVSGLLFVVSETGLQWSRMLIGLNLYVCCVTWQELSTEFYEEGLKKLAQRSDHELLVCIVRVYLRPS